MCGRCPLPDCLPSVLFRKAHYLSLCSLWHTQVVQYLMMSKIKLATLKQPFVKPLVLLIEILFLMLGCSVGIILQCMKQHNSLMTILDFHMWGVALLSLAHAECPFARRPQISQSPAAPLALLLTGTSRFNTSLRTPGACLSCSL